MKEEDSSKMSLSSSSEILKTVVPKDLPPMEMFFGDITAAMNELKKRSLGQADVLHLQSIIQGAKVYMELFADYLDYRGIEAGLDELEGKFRDFFATKTVRKREISHAVDCCRRLGTEVGVYGAYGSSSSVVVCLSISPRGRCLLRLSADKGTIL